MEDRTYIQNLYIVERVCGICSDSHMTCYVQCVEEAMDLEIPERAEYIRVIVAELERIHSHLLWLGVAAHEIGFDTLFFYIWRDREVVMDLLELISGNRVNYAMPTIGGVRRDITPEMEKELRKGLKILYERTEYYKQICLNEKTILQRAVGVGILTPRQAVELCAVGPTLRASGIKSDVRADDPYIAYDRIPFEVVTYDWCDVAARVMVRIDEVLEAIKMIEYCLDHMPRGPIRVKVPVMMKVPEGEVVSRVEAPRGELIHYLVSRGGIKPYRYKIRSPTLGNIPAVCEMLKGGYIADVPIVLAAIDPCFSCTDRIVFYDVGKDKRWVWTHEQLRRYGIEFYKRNRGEVR